MYMYLFNNYNKNMKQFKSFSLVELMVVIAIIGILSSIAVPSYRNYIIRSRIIEAITIMQERQLRPAEAGGLNIRLQSRF